MSLRSALLLLLAVDVEVAASLKVAVFGATGRVGSLVVDQLLAADHMVTAVVRDEVKANSVLPNTAATQSERTNRPKSAEFPHFHYVLHRIDFGPKGQ